MKPMPVARPPARMTAAQMLADPTYRKGWEIWDDTPVVRDSSGGQAEVSGMFLGADLVNHVRPRGLGWVTGSSQGFLVARRPDRVLSPDVAFTSSRRLAEVPQRTFIPFAPDFAAEVKSPTDSWNLLVTRLALWLSYGTRLAWGIDPEALRVTVLRPRRPARLAYPGQTLSLAPVLPGLSIRVGSLFTREA